jgi:16S rRNA (cytosine1402-N4)-methyltransferase
MDELMDNPDQKQQRRVRYTGTHPKAFAEKYKELQPEKYAETVAKVIAKGNTPAGMHRPICVDEILELFQIQEGQIGLDATLGYGGHTEAFLHKLNHTGHLVSIDADPVELPKTRERLAALGYAKKEVTILNLNFKDIDQLSEYKQKCHFILADLGVSSMQIDNPDRGFSFKHDGPLDLRMNPEQGIPAAYRLKAMSEEEIEGMLLENADEPNAARIARAIVAEYKLGKRIQTTFQLKEVILTALAYLPVHLRGEEHKKACQRTFQALRIDVNHEFEALGAFLDAVPELLAPGGRVAILSFHSGEDRLVKKAFQYYHRQGIYSQVAEDFIRPSMAEQSSNSRAKSAKLRWAEKK